MAQVLCPVVIGRDAELEAVDAALTAAMTGHGGCIAIAGEPGIGKSRLVLETASRAASRGLRVITGRGVPQSATAAYRPLTDALVQLLRDRPVPDDTTMEPWLPALGALLPGMAGLVPGGGSGAGEVSPGIRGEALIQLLRRLAPDGLVIVLEDLHWADPDTVALMEYLGEHLDGESVLCVLTLRANGPSAALELARRQRGRPGVLHLELDRLTDEDMARMVKACIPGAGAELLRRVQASAEGVPLLVEDLLASPGLPKSFTETVRERLAGFSEPQRSVIEAAAILGRHFDWELLPAVSGQTADLVAGTLGLAVEQLLVTADGTAFRFRHALTREALLDTMLPPRQRALAAAALAALHAAHPRLDGLRELAADLANRAGDRRRAGTLLSESGGQALAWGALATAIGTLRRAADLLEGTPERDQAELLLVESLALAGRVEEAAAAGGQLITRLGTEGADLRTEVHLRLSQAAVAASRWQMARHHLAAARRLAGTSPPAGVRARMGVLDAEVAFAADDLDEARLLAEKVLAAEDGAPDVRCHALELIGRSHRLRDLSAARSAFERALVTAEAADLPLWRLRALHELGTIDLFDHAGVDRLSEARRAAEQMGALGTVAILELQLAAGYTCRWELDTCDAYAQAAVAGAGRLGLGQVRAKALAVLAGSASMRADAERAERYAAQAIAADPDDRMLDGFRWATRGAVVLLGGDAAAAAAPYARGMAILAALPHAEPAGLRALWPLLLAALGDRRAERAIEEARRLGVGAFRMNRSVIGYAEAVLAGRAGHRQRANELAAACDAGFTNCEAWGELARFCAAPAALADGWGDPLRWLAEAEAGFDRRGLPRLAEYCRELLKESQPNPWVAAGITAREADVLRLVAGGLANKQIAARLDVSPRTVEKHVESLLRKTGARSRTGLVAAAAPAASATPSGGFLPRPLRSPGGVPPRPLRSNCGLAALSLNKCPRHPSKMGLKSLTAVSCLLLTCLCAACGLATAAAPSAPPAAAAPPTTSAEAPAKRTAPLARPATAPSATAPSATAPAPTAPAPTAPAPTAPARTAPARTPRCPEYPAAAYGIDPNQVADTGGGAQLVTVVDPSTTSLTGTFAAWAKGADGCWSPVSFAGQPAQPFLAETGYGGLLPIAQRVPGDWATPTGLFAFGTTVYGNSTVSPTASYPYHHLICGDWWDEQPGSPTYDTFQHVPCGITPPYAGDSEALWTEVQPYQHFIDIKMPGPPDNGAGIFLHDDVPEGYTEGCVALPNAELDAVLGWLNPADSPHVLISVG